ncbi:MAG: helix-turn-helix domain-containing protein, partial [Prevotella salivae]|nr:helix-turn-helix domain-containing protein [Segatella salivae]
LNVIVNTIVKYKPKHVVFDPVISSFLKEKLMSRDVISQIRLCLLPLCSVIIIQHSENDLLLGECSFPNVYFIEDIKRHGVRNVFTSAVAVYLQKGKSNEEAFQLARKYVEQSMVSPSPLNGRSLELFHEFIHLVHQNYQTNSDVAFYANCMNVSARYLAQVCKRVVSKSPKAIIDDYIVDQLSKSLTAETSKTIQQLAYEFGFSNQAHFSKFFHKIKGISPSEYRKLQQE